VFPNLAGSPISNANLLQRAFYPALRRAGLRKIRFHDLRHTFASLLIANGEDIVRVSRLLGHANPTITLKVYSHMLPKEHYGTTQRLLEMVSGTTNMMCAQDQSPAPVATVFDTGSESHRTLRLPLQLQMIEV
jgi:integrase